MQVDKDKVVSIDYTLKDDTGQVIDTSEGREPLAFVYGSGAIIPGLERALEGKNPCDDLKVSVEPAEGYGEYNDQLIVEVSKDNFEEGAEINEGMQVQATRSDGSAQILTVKDIADDTVTLDANHPLAGQTLHFDVEITDVREATPEELEHGHAH
jgi:FKBP-type peptidyl-prolyl cis-trans isomerase SlyD